MEDFEKLGQFYLGKKYNLSTGRLEESLVIYDSKDLVTHGVCVGMTGSGKTGLCISILEEAAIDNIPAIVIDPKGDMSNLLLNFPDLSTDEFLPWINGDDAARANQSPEQFAAGQAELWKKGLMEWGQDGNRVRKLRESAEFAIYTPGSTAGTPVSVLNSFACPSGELLEEREAAADLISSATTGLLGLLGISADPISSREHILIANIIQQHWKQGRDVDLALLIRSIQSPPFEKLGAFDVDSFFPAKERFGLAMALNNLLAAPGFGSWLEGEALDVGRLLHTAEGKPRVSVFSIAHLSDAERMFFVTLLLNRIVAWMRAQPGTTSLRALLYMDEVAGYLPPVANPSSKKPLMLLFKQARAFGIGVLLATQNPVDLDYKALANAGTWFLGRMQTAQDIDRLVQGLGSVTADAGSDLRSALAALGKRVFLMKNIHEDAPEIFQTRWTLSYLRGPLTPAQIKVLRAAKRTVQPASAQPASVQPASPKPAPQAAEIQPAGRPNLPPQVPQYFLPLRGAMPTGAQPVYKPAILGVADVAFGTDNRRQSFIAGVGEISVAWDQAEAGAVDENQLEKDPVEQAEFSQLPGPAYKPQNYKTWERDFSGFLYRTSQIETYRNPDFKLKSNPGESERDFRIRVSQMAREKRDEATEALRRKYAPKIAALEDRIRRAEQRVEKEKADMRQAGVQAAVSLGATLLGAFMGRKTLSTGNIGRASSTIRGGMRTARERTDIAAASENVEALQQQRNDLEAEFNAETKSLESLTDPTLQKIEAVAQRPKKADIAVRLVALVWLPHLKTPDGTIRPAYS
jgi:hypothetical protein